MIDAIIDGTDEPLYVVKSRMPTCVLEIFFTLTDMKKYLEIYDANFRKLNPEVSKKLNEEFIKEFLEECDDELD